jgi:hypothetical protein
MIKASVLYPKTATSTFDMTYYLPRHIPALPAPAQPASLITSPQSAPGSASARAD